MEMMKRALFVNSADIIDVGGRLQGLFPLARATALTVGATHADRFTNVTPYRQDAPAFCYQHRRMRRALDISKDPSGYEAAL